MVWFWLRVDLSPLQRFHCPDLTSRGTNRIHLCQDARGPDVLVADRSLSQTDPPTTDPELLQIFIRSTHYWSETDSNLHQIITRKEYLQEDQEGEADARLKVQNPEEADSRLKKYKIQTHLGIPACMQNLIYSGKSLHDKHTLQGKVYMINTHYRMTVLSQIWPLTSIWDCEVDAPEPFKMA